MAPVTFSLNRNAVDPPGTNPDSVRNRSKDSLQENLENQEVFSRNLDFSLTEKRNVRNSERFRVRQYIKKELDYVKMDLMPNLPLYLATLALLVTGLVAMYFFKRFKKIESDISHMRELKNQIVALDTRVATLTQKTSEFVSCGCNTHEMDSTTPQVEDEQVSEPDGDEELIPEA